MVDFVEPDDGLLSQDKEVGINELKGFAQIEDVNGEGEETNVFFLGVAHKGVKGGETSGLEGTDGDTNQHDQRQRGHEDVVDKGERLDPIGGFFALGERVISLCFVLFCFVFIVVTVVMIVNVIVLLLLDCLFELTSM